MPKFHINPAGEVGVCTARPGFCPLTDERDHYLTAEAAREAFEKSQQVWPQSGNGLVPGVIRGRVHYEKGSIFSAVPANIMEPYYSYLRDRISSEDYAAAVENKTNREGLDSFHITVVNYRDLSKIKKDRGELPRLSEDLFSETIVGVGSAQNDTGRAFFCVVDSPGLQKFRSKFDLPKADFHITLGFIGPKDVYDRPKGIETLI